MDAKEHIDTGCKVTGGCMAGICARQLLSTYIRIDNAKERNYLCSYVNTLH